MECFLKVTFITLQKIKIMEVITIDSEAFKQLMIRFNQIEEKIKYFSPRALMEDEYVDVIGACKLIGISRTTLFKYIEREEIAYHKYNRKLRFHISDIQAFLAKRKKTVPPSLL